MASGFISHEGKEVRKAGVRPSPGKARFVSTAGGAQCTDSETGSLSPEPSCSGPGVGLAVSPAGLGFSVPDTFTASGGGGEALI